MQLSLKGANSNITESKDEELLFFVKLLAPGILWIVMAIISSNILFQLMALSLVDEVTLSTLSFSMLICSWVGFRRRG